MDRGKELFLIFCAYDVSVFLFLSAHSTCSSYTCESYGEVVRSAFGEVAEQSVSWLLFTFLMFVIMAYMVLIRDIWSPLVEEVVLIRSSSSDSDLINGDYVLLGIVVFLLPCLFQRSLHALRYLNYVGSASIFILCLALCRGGYQRINDESSRLSAWDDIEIFKVPSLQDILFSFPIVMLSFLCHFNIISIQNALRQPTRQRTRQMIQYALMASFLLMYLFGLGGYLYAGRKTQGNILRNVKVGRVEGEDVEEYYLFLLGRIGIGLTIMLAMPLMLLPCREALLEVVDIYFHHSHHRSSGNNDGLSNVNITSNIEEDNSCWKIFHRLNKAETEYDAIITTEDEVKEIIPPPVSEMGPRRLSRPSLLVIRHDPIQSDYIFRNTALHYGSTLLITITCYLGAVAVQGVAVIWGFIGSSFGFLIAFILPCGCFVVIESAVPTSLDDGGDRHDKWIKVAWVILVCSVIGAIVCTINSFVQ